MYIPPSIPYSGDEKLLFGIDIGTSQTSLSVAHLNPDEIPKPLTIPLQIPSVILFDKNGTALACGDEAETLFKSLSAAQDGSDKESDFTLVKDFKLHLHPARMRFDTTLPPATQTSLAPPPPLQTRMRDMWSGRREQPVIQVPDLPNLPDPQFPRPLPPSPPPSTIASQTPAPVVPTPDIEPTPLPPNVTVTSTYSTFFSYIFGITKKWFVKNVEGGDDIWRKNFERGSMEFVVGISDGWDDSQQKVLRDAMVDARIVERSRIEDKVHFIREAEACVHFLLEKSENVQRILKPGQCFTVVNAGASTVNTCMYKCDAIYPKLALREIKASDSVTAGGLYVDRAVSPLVSAKLASQMPTTSPAIVDQYVARWEQTSKRAYAGTPQLQQQSPAPASVQVQVQVEQDPVKTEDAVIPIEFTTEEMEATFDFCVNEILTSVDQQIEASGQRSTHIVLTGGFGDSPYLQGRLREAMGPQFTLVTCSGSSKQAVSEGTLHWFLRQAVNERAVRFTFGNHVCVRVRDLFQQPTDGRVSYSWPDGEQMFNGAWSSIVQQGTIMKTTEPVAMPFYKLVTNNSDLNDFSSTIYRYEGAQYRPRWVMGPEGSLLPGFREQCKVSANLSNLSNILTAVPRQDGKKGTYYKVDFKICLFVAQNSLKAKLEWVENGITKQGPASVVIADGLQNVPPPAQTRGGQPQQDRSQYQGGSYAQEQGTRQVSSRYVSKSGKW